MEEKWFDGLSDEYKLMYKKICYNIAHSILIKQDEEIIKNIRKEYEDTMNNLKKEYEKKINKKEEEVNMKEKEMKEIIVENKCLRTNNSDKITKLNDKLDYIKDEINKNFTPLKLGRLGEKNFYEFLTTRYPKCETIDSSRQKGNGDFIFKCHNIRFLIEYKTLNENALRCDPGKVFDRFTEDSKASIENNITDMAIFVAQNVKSIPGYGTFESQELITSRGKTYLIYISDIYNVPERMDAAIELGVQLYLNTDNNESDGVMTKIIDLNNKINQIVDNIDRMVKNNDEGLKIINNMRKILNDNREEFNNTVEEVSMKQKIIDIVCDVMDKYGNQKTTIKLLEDELRCQNIPPSKIRFNGGVKQLKMLAKEQLRLRKLKCSE